jgi:hypothetical protein
MDCAEQDCETHREKLAGRIEYGSGKSWLSASADLERRLVSNNQAPVEKTTQETGLDRYAHLRAAEPHVPTEADAKALARKKREA